MLRAILLALVVLTLSIPAAEARCLQYEPGSLEQQKADQHLLDKAVFVGIVQVLEINDAEEDPELGGMYQTTVRPVQAYVGSLPDTAAVSGNISFESVSAGQVGEFYERIIFEEKGEFRTTGWCQLLSKESWKKLREEAQPNAEVSSLKSTCETKSGVLQIYGTKLQCLYPASDSGKTCRVSEECDGVCDIDVTDNQKMKLLLENDIEVKLSDVSGTCTQWRNPPGCFNVFGNGLLKRDCFQ